MTNPIQPLSETAMAAAREICQQAHRGLYRDQFLPQSGIHSLRAHSSIETIENYYGRMIDRHFESLRADLAAAKARAAENEELAETGQKLSELVWENAAEGDDAYEVEDVLESHYKLIATLREMLAARSAFELGLNAQLAQLRAGLAAKGELDGLTLDDLTNAFLRWPLPESVCVDLCATKQGMGRIGTNLLSFTEAKQMFREVALAARTSGKGKK